MFSRSQQDRFKKLARSLDALAAKDSQRIAREREISAIRQAAAGELYEMLSGFVKSVNDLVTEVRLDLAPSDFTASEADEFAVNLFQINVSGRVIQFTFKATDAPEERVDLRTPYTISGAVRWFNQELLDHDDIRDHRLYYCIGKSDRGWRYFDPRGARTGAVDTDYLATLLEQLV